LITIEQGNQIREAHYIMDGPSDRPKTIPECHAMIGGLLELLGAITGITNAAEISPGEETAKDDYERELHFAADAHELPLELVCEVEAILYGPSDVDEITDDQYGRAAQLIARCPASPAARTRRTSTSPDPSMPVPRWPHQRGTTKTIRKGVIQ
jgi:hypothetical protein